MALDPIMVEEWIGRKMRVIDALNPAQVGLEGIVVDESSRTLLIRLNNGREIRIQKKGTRLQATNNGKIAIIDAGKALMRPEDRTKRLYRHIIE